MLKYLKHQISSDKKKIETDVCIHRAYGI